MKLIIYNIENSKANRTCERLCRVNRGTGVFTFSGELVKCLGLKTGDRVIVANDQEDKKGWYICKTDNEAGFVVTGKDKALLIRNSFVAGLLLSSIKIEKSASFLVAKEPIVIDGEKYYQLITTKPINIDATKKFKKKG
jgi:hypothetical protein